MTDEGVGSLKPEGQVAAGRALDELRTIQYLEEVVGPTGLRRLAASLPDADRETVLEIRRRAANASLELESIIDDWSHILGTRTRQPSPAATGGLPAAEIVESFVEVKRASAELLRRAAKDAPNEKLRARLMALAMEEDDAAEILKRVTLS